MRLNVTAAAVVAITAIVDVIFVVAFISSA